MKIGREEKRLKELRDRPVKSMGVRLNIQASAGDAASLDPRSNQAVCREDATDACFGRIECPENGPQCPKAI